MPSDARILIVDDHVDTLYALESALAPLGYRVTRATNGDAALKEVLRGQVGLLLLDVRMPKVSGLDVVRYMRRVEQTQHIPIILLTGFGVDSEITSAAFARGVGDLVKGRAVGVEPALGHERQAHVARGIDGVHEGARPLARSCSGEAAASREA